MADTFELPGKDPSPKGRRVGSWVVLGLLGLGVLALAVKAVYNRPTRGAADPQALYQQAEARNQLFASLLPGARVPEPFYLRGTGEEDGIRAAWMRRDFDDTHALLVAADAPPAAADMELLLADLGGERMPARQMIDENGVQPEKRPPFVEEFRSVPDAGDPVEPPRGWTREWDEAVSFRVPEGGTALELTMSAEQAFPLAAWRQSAPYWWTVVDLSSRAPEGRLYLLHFTHGERAPSAGPLHDFVRALLP